MLLNKLKDNWTHGPRGSRMSASVLKTNGGFVREFSHHWLSCSSINTLTHRSISHYKQPFCRRWCLLWRIYSECALRRKYFNTLPRFQRIICIRALHPIRMSRSAEGAVLFNRVLRDENQHIWHSARSRLWRWWITLMRGTQGTRRLQRVGVDKASSQISIVSFDSFIYVLLWLISDKRLIMR